MTWDLFNPIPNFNYNYMSKNIDPTVLENPYIQVIWEDTPENFTQERIKSVKQYFMKKYVSTNVNVITIVDRYAAYLLSTIANDGGCYKCTS